MNRFAKTSLLALALATVAYAPARADITDIRTEDRAVELDIGANNLKYGEDYGGVSLDTESGWQTTLAGSARYLMNDNVKFVPLRDVYFAVNFDSSFGDTDYNGGLVNTVTGVVTPYKTTTHDTIVNFSGQIGRGIPLFDQLMVTPLLDVGYHYWNRSLTGIGSYTEDYTNGSVQGGVMVQWSPIPKWVFGITGEGGTTFDSQVRGLDDTKLDLGSQNIYAFSGKVGYTMTKYFEVTGQVKFVGFGYGVSPVKNGLLEPNSYTHDTTLLVGVAYHLP